ncbi:hypothetical protein Poli38472_013016 [Pythium oligandrum]|uniref:Uncharacterized protein n=1 Tax=Pythium oligandrum TaxID=41045 RepID=A0A8K1FKP0_PYTOL|nr:hypothetical protein Poli38472_013016 [Pythium oligandrum]|eukprot:TMW64394.1 hypothetical protein Poli38472_013016 [Pythium oligandrum]
MIMTMTRPEFWSCLTQTCAQSTETEASTRVLSVPEVPSSNLSPLCVDCSTCKLRMVSCECCQLLLAVEKEVDGVLLCRRCGFLSVLDVKLRGLVQLPPVSRIFLNHFTPSVSEIVRLEAQYTEWIERAKAYEANSASPGASESARKRQRVIAHDGNVPIQVRVSQELKDEKRKLETELQASRAKWKALLDEAASEKTSTAELQALQQNFSATHLNILRIMYQTSMQTAELHELVTQIERFLLHQSTIVKAKYDVLSSVRSCSQVDVLKRMDTNIPDVITSGHGRNETSVDDKSTTDAIEVVKQLTNAQLRHSHREFERIARPYLQLVGVANKHLFALYNAAQSIAKMEATQMERDGSTRSNGGVNTPSPSLPLMPENSRKRRLFGGGGHAVSPSGGDLSRVQHDLELRHRISEISKKVELWRSLSWTIGSTCVLTLIELSQAQQST